MILAVKILSIWLAAGFAVALVVGPILKRRAASND